MAVGAGLRNGRLGILGTCACRLFSQLGIFLLSSPATAPRPLLQSPLPSSGRLAAAPGVSPLRTSRRLARPLCGSLPPQPYLPWGSARGMTGSTPCSPVSSHTEERVTRTKVTLGNFYSDLIAQHEEREMGQKKLEKVMEEEDLRMNRNDARDQRMLGRKQSFFV